MSADIVSPNFILHSPTCDAAMPEWRHFVCDGWPGSTEGSGFAWHVDPQKQICYHGQINAPAELVARILDNNRPIDQLVALREIIVGDDNRAPQHGAVVKFFRDVCDCGMSHDPYAHLWKKAALAIEPDAIDDLREANPPLSMLLLLNVPESRKRKLHGKHRSGQTRHGLPYLIDPETHEINHALSAAAQSSWALDIIARRESPIRSRGPRKRIKVIV